jgi:signal transduction histidine kinase
MTTILLMILIAILVIYCIKIKIKGKIIEKSFTSIVNHTFRTPLTRIKWMSDNLNPETTLAEQMDIAKNISYSTNHLLEIVDTLAGIKDLNNGSVYAMKTISLREIIEEGISKFNKPLNEKKLKLQIPTFSSIPLLTADTKKLSFVIHSVLENAIWYSKNEGKILIDANISGNSINLSVSDDGIGMSWKDTLNVGDRFYRSTEAVKMNTDGMGLSLYMAKQIMKMHGGRISFKSSGRNRGSVFYIKIPISG